MGLNAGAMKHNQEGHSFWMRGPRKACQRGGQWTGALMDKEEFSRGGVQQAVVGKEMTEIGRTWVFKWCKWQNCFLFVCFGMLFSFLETFLKNSQYGNCHLTNFSTTSGPFHSQPVIWEFIIKFISILKCKAKTFKLTSQKQTLLASVSQL